jgi:molybdopterin synthase sulfur carrier subunit
MSARVRFAALLHDYTDGRDEVEVEGQTLGEIMDDLDRRFPGLAFRVIDEQGRVRQHMKVFVGEDSAGDRESPIREGAELFIVGALSGG